MLVQAEFPMFGGRVACDASYACDKNAVYFQDWAFMIKTLRNFPAVFDYTMTNEGPLLNHQVRRSMHQGCLLNPRNLVFYPSFTHFPPSFAHFQRLDARNPGSTAKSPGKKRGKIGKNRGK